MTDWQFEMFNRGKANGHDTCLVYISKYISLISVTYDVGTLWNCFIDAIPMCTYNICQFNKRMFFTINFFSRISQLLFMFQCNEHVEMNKFVCSVACTWITIIDSQFYIIDSLSLDVSLE